jgi:hypothetical protein
VNVTSVPSVAKLLSTPVISPNVAELTGDATNEIAYTSVAPVNSVVTFTTITSVIEAPGIV